MPESKISLRLRSSVHNPPAAGPIPTTDPTDACSLHRSRADRSANGNRTLPEPLRLAERASPISSPLRVAVAEADTAKQQALRRFLERTPRLDWALFWSYSWSITPSPGASRQRGAPQRVPELGGRPRGGRRQHPLGDSGGQALPDRPGVRRPAVHSSVKSWPALHGSEIRGISLGFCPLAPPPYTASGRYFGPLPLSCTSSFRWSAVMTTSTAASTASSAVLMVTSWVKVSATF